MAAAGRKDRFFSQGGQRIIENAIVITKQTAAGALPANLLRFINSAANSPEELHSDEFRKSFHYQCLKEAYEKPKSPTDIYDYELAWAYFSEEHPKMADRTRSSLVAVVMNVLHGFNTGVNRWLFATDTTASPLLMDQGKWIFINMPISRCGEEGAFALGAWKYMTEWHILRRNASLPNCADFYPRRRIT